jgi:hypothetical protein
MMTPHTQTVLNLINTVALILLILGISYLILQRTKIAMLIQRLEIKNPKDLYFAALGILYLLISRLILRQKL